MDVNEIELKVTDSFFFRRFEKIDWKQIGILFLYECIIFPKIVISAFLSNHSFRQSRSAKRQIKFQLERHRGKYRKYSLLSFTIRI